MVQTCLEKDPASLLSMMVTIPEEQREGWEITAMVDVGGREQVGPGGLKLKNKDHYRKTSSLEKNISSAYCAAEEPGSP